jgi:hypothetical protein
VGTIRKTVGAAAVTDCAPCDAGYYCQEGSSTVTGPCDKGYYCPTNIINTYGSVPALIGSYGPRHAPCPEGTYTDVTATPDVDSCKPCSEGYYCPIASSAEVICDRGYYCVANSSKPEPCPIGRYGNVSGKKLFARSFICWFTYLSGGHRGCDHIVVGFTPQYNIM